MVHLQRNEKGVIERAETLYLASIKDQLTEDQLDCFCRLIWIPVIMRSESHRLKRVMPLRRDAPMRTSSRCGMVLSLPVRSVSLLKPSSRDHWTGFFGRIKPASDC